MKRGAPIHTGSPAGRVIYQKNALWQAGNGKNRTARSFSRDDTGDGLRFRYQPPPARFLFDRRISQPAARDTPLVPEPGTAWRRDIRRHDLADGKALPSRAWRRGTPRCCSRSRGRCRCGSRSAGCSRCCSRSPRAARAQSRTFFLTRDAAPVFCRPAPPPASANCPRAPHAPPRSAHWHRSPPPSLRASVFAASPRSGARWPRVP